jgi:hypothetical protein
MEACVRTDDVGEVFCLLESKEYSQSTLSELITLAHTCGNADMAELLLSYTGDASYEVYIGDGMQCWPVTTMRCRTLQEVYLQCPYAYAYVYRDGLVGPPLNDIHAQLHKALCGDEGILMSTLPGLFPNARSEPLAA